MMTSSGTFNPHLDLAQQPDGAHFVIRPNQSLSQSGARLLVLSIAFFAGVISLLTLMKGLWPVSAFVSIDAAGAILAMSLFRIAQRHRMEEILIGENTITVRCQGFRCPKSEETWPCYGMSIIAHHDPDYGMRRLELRLRGNRLEIARDLSPPERETFAGALTHELRKFNIPLKREVPQSLTY